MAETSVRTIKELPKSTEIGGRSDWGNKLVVNTGLNPVVNFAFMLRVEGVFDLPCKAVKGIHRENEFDYIQEGGLNDYVHLKRKPISKPFTFQVERYVGINWVDPLPLGTELVLPVILFVNKHVFPGLQPVRNYVFTGCTVISKDYGELNAEVSGLLLETVTIAYREMVCLDIPMDAFNDNDVWKFDGKKKEGKGDRHYNTNLYNNEWETQYNSAQQMEKRAKANRYQHIGNKAGQGTSSAKHIEGELTADKMQEKAKLWKPEKDERGRLKNKRGKNYESLVTDYNKAIDEEIKAATTPEEKKAAEEKRIAMSAAASRKYEHSAVPKQYSSAKHLKSELSEEKMIEKAEADRWEAKSAKGEGGQLKPKHGRDYESFATDFNKAIDEEIKAATTPEEKKAAEEKRIAMSAAASRKYEHSAVPKQYSSAKHLKSELSEEKMIEKAEADRWEAKSAKGEGGQLKPKHGRDYESFATDFNKAIDKEVKEAETPEEKKEAEGKRIAMSAAASRKYEHSAVPKQYSSAKHPKEEYSLAEMEAKAKKYSHSAKAKQYSSAKHPKEEYSLTEMEAKAKKYSHSAKAKQYSSAKHPKEEYSLTEMEEKAKKYSHSAKAKQYSSAKHSEEEYSLAQMEEKAKLWPKQSSAHTGKMKKSKSKKWPESSSAHTKKMKEVQPKLWPAQQSAKREEMKVPEARLWPQTRSARQITDFLKNH